MTYTRTQLADYENLYLAWKRIQTSTNPKYKYLLKESLDAFSWNLEKNLRLLSSEIIDRIYEPSRTSKFYLPKKSGLVRPVTLLNVKDQIFYQAIINLICISKTHEIKRFRDNHVFGGFNIYNPSSIFFLSKWKNEHDKYQNKIKNHFKNGYIWLAKFDLASFFDVIDHKILINIFCKNSLSKELKQDLLKALEKWTQPQEINFFHSQGIPQGPSASTILADIYLHQLDEKIIKNAPKYDVKYLRYVDDIVLMAKDRLSTENILIQLDIVARELSLIPQSSKTLIKKVINIDEELKGTNSLFQFLDNERIEKRIKSQKFLKKLFLESVKPIKNSEIEILDVTNVKFCLYRLLPDPDVTDYVIRIIKNHFYLTDLCVVYLQQSRLDQQVSTEITSHIQSKPNHDWHTAQLLKLYEYVDEKQQEIFQTIIIRLITDRDKHWIVKKALLNIAQNNEDLSVVLLEELIENVCNENMEKALPYYISLLSVNLKIQPDITLKKIANCLLSCNYKNVPVDFLVFIGYFAKKNNYSLNKELLHNIYIQNFFEDKDESVDGISYGLISLFDLSIDHINYIDFRIYLNNDEYEKALNNLCLARGYFENYPENFIQIIDVFNQILLVKIYKQDNETIPEHELGNMIKKLKKHIPEAYNGFQKCHELRCEIETIHAYSSCKKLNKGLNNPFGIRDKLHKKLSISYEVILEYIRCKHWNK